MYRRGKHTSVTIEVLLGNGVFCGSRPETEDPRQLGELSEALETAVEDEWEEMAAESQWSVETLACQDMSLGVAEFH
jgi:hypothetical protein